MVGIVFKNEHILINFSTLIHIDKDYIDIFNQKCHRCCLVVISKRIYRNVKPRFEFFFGAG